MPNRRQITSTSKEKGAVKKCVVESHIFPHSPFLAFPLRGRGTALVVDEVARRQEFSS